MTIYTCPMHPEIEQEMPGKCPKCGMKLVPKDSLVHEAEAKHGDNSNYTPLMVIVSLILIASVTISFVIGLTVTTFLATFMIGFFLVFSGFKLMDLPGFAQGYSTYDLLAKRVYGYGYIYPFIELFFGLAMILGVFFRPLLIGEVLVMTFSGVGVANKLLKGEKFQCACLGTFLKVPLTKVTLIEDFGMAFLALVLLLIGKTIY